MFNRNNNSCDDLNDTKHWEYSTSDILIFITIYVSMRNID